MSSAPDEKNDYREAFVAVVVTVLGEGLVNIIFEQLAPKFRIPVDVVFAITALIGIVVFFKLRRGSEDDVLRQNKQHIADEMEVRWLTGTAAKAAMPDAAVEFPIAISVKDWRGNAEKLSESQLLPRFCNRMFIEADQNVGQAFLTRRIQELVSAYNEDETKTAPVPVAISAESWFNTKALLEMDRDWKENDTQIVLQTVPPNEDNEPQSNETQQKPVKNEQSNFRDWVVLQLKKRYGIPKEGGELLFDQEQLIYIIEGVEKVGTHHDFAAESEERSVSLHAKHIQDLFYAMLNAYDKDRIPKPQIVLLKMLEKCDKQPPWKEQLSSVKDLMQHLLNKWSGSVEAKDGSWEDGSVVNCCKVRISYPRPRALEAWLEAKGPNAAALKTFIRIHKLDELYAKSEYQMTLEIIANKCAKGAVPEVAVNGQYNLPEMRQSVYTEYFKKQIDRVDAIWKKRPGIGVQRFRKDVIRHRALEKILQAAWAAIIWHSGDTVDAVFRLDEIQPKRDEPNTLRHYRLWLWFLLAGFITVVAGVPSGLGVWYGWYSRGHDLIGIESGLATLLFILVGGVIAGGCYQLPIPNGKNQDAMDAGESESSKPLQSERSKRKRLHDPPRKVDGSAWMLLRSICIGAAFGIGRGAAVAFAATTHDSATPHQAGILQGVVAAIGATLIFFWYFVSLADNPYVISIEEHKSAVNWNRAVIAVVISVGVALAVYLSGDRGNWERGAAFGAVLLVFNLAFFVRKQTNKPSRIRPNGAIRQAAITASVYSGMLAVVAAFCFGCVYDLGYHSRREGNEVAFEAMSFLLTFFFLNGLSVMKYLALRHSLAATGRFPKFFDLSLEFATDMGLLSSVGGGYKCPNDDIRRFIRDYGKPSGSDGAYSPRAEAW